MRRLIDAVSRQAAIDAIKNADVCMAWNGEIPAEDAADIAVWATKRSVVDSVEELPPAQPERETAKFIRWMECKKTDKYISYTPHCKCSKCGNELLIESINYCYMCGARMVGERRTDEPD